MHGKTTALVAAAALLLTAATTTLVARQAPSSPYPTARPMPLAPAGTAARGAQLVTLGGCHDCHTPKLATGAPDMTRELSGQPTDAPLPPNVIGGVSANMLLTAWRGPWGVSLARNLTPDRETGIGTWTLADFKKTIRTGINPKGEALLPPMPIQLLQNLPDSDLDAIFAYLRTIKPVRNVVGKALPPKT
jgi:mono/diheme cytochrome c family protein